MCKACGRSRHEITFGYMQIANIVDPTAAEGLDLPCHACLNSNAVVVRIEDLCGHTPEAGGFQSGTT